MVKKTYLNSRKGINLKLNLNFSNKTAYTLIAILSFLILGGIVYAYNANGVGGNPAVMGHSADEIQGMVAGGGSCGFGNYEPKSSGIDYTATTDGIVVANGVVYGGGFDDRMSGFTPINTLVAKANDNGGNAGEDTITFPVKKGNTWKVTQADVVNWIPLNCGGSGGSGSFECVDYNRPSGESGNQYCNSISKVCIGIWDPGMGSYADECSVTPTYAHITRCCSSGSSTSDSVPSGTLCGWADTGGGEKVYTNCQGFSILAGSCPSGYTYKRVLSIESQDQYSCVKN